MKANQIVAFFQADGTRIHYIGGEDLNVENIHMFYLFIEIVYDRADAQNRKNIHKRYVYFPIAQC